MRHRSLVPRETLAGGVRVTLARRAALLAVLLAFLAAVPSVGAGHAGTGGISTERVNDEYTIPYNVILGGLGGGLFQGEMKAYASYTVVHQDNEEGGSNAVLVVLTISVFGPGSNLDAGAFSVTLTSHTCTTATQVATSTGTNTATSHATRTWEFLLDDDSANPTECAALVRVARTGALGFNLDVPATFKNSDGGLSPLEILTGVDELALFGLFLILFAAYAVMAFNRDPASVAGAAVVVLIVAVVLLVLATHILVLAVGAIMGSVSVVRTVSVLIAFDQERKATKPKKPELFS